MLYTPINLLPNNSSIDATSNNTFTWEVTGQSGFSPVAFQLFIEDNQDNSSVYDSTKITSALSSHQVPSSTLTNRLPDYKWKVRVWWDATNYVDSDWVIVRANATPTLSMTVNDLTVQNHTFTATYSQAQNIPVKQFKFLLYGETGVITTNIVSATSNSSGSGINLQGEYTYELDIVQETDWVYSTTIEYQIKGLLNGKHYGIKATAINQNDQTISTGILTFTTAYNVPDDIPDLTVTPSNDYGLITLDWTNVQQVLPVAVGGYSYVTGKFDKGISLDSGTTLTYTEDYTEDFTQLFYLKLAPGYSGVFLILEDASQKQFKVGYDGQRFYYINEWRTTGGKAVTLPADYFLVGIKPNQVIIITDTYTEIII